MKIIIKTLGCKANRYESDRISEKFNERFYIEDAQNNPKEADLIIINTCTVTHVADRKSRQAIASLKVKFPSAKIIVFGCGANTDPNGYKSLENVDYVVQTREKLDSTIGKISESFTASCEVNQINQNRTRALIKIQDGCNNFCSYCIVPFARGREKSRPSDEIIQEINGKVNKGYKEIVLTGINIGMWKEGGKELADLIQKILDETAIERVRLSSIEPENFSEKFLGLFKNPRFCPHLHISLQSGSDTILKSMRRRYDTALYKDILKRLRKVSPNISITTDIIVGFPGETEKLFNETVEFVKKMRFSKIHIFPYSPREGTLAADMQNQIDSKTKKKRCKLLSQIEEKMRKDFYKNNIKRDEKVLIERYEDGFATGLTTNYMKVRIHKEIQPNTIVKTRLESVDDNIGIVGSLET